MMDELGRARERIGVLEAELDKARERDRLLSSILEHAPDYIAHVTLEGRLLFLNRFSPGYDVSILVGATIFDFTVPAFHDVIRSTIARVVETRAPQAYESSALGTDGRFTPYYTRVAPIEVNDAVTSLVLIATDVTRLKQAEAAAAESQATLQHVLDATGMGTWWRDLDVDGGGWDAACARTLGYDPAAEHPDPATRFQHTHPEDRERLRQAYVAAATTGVFGPIEHRVIRRDGSVRWVITSARSVTGPHGMRLLGGLLDVTDRKQLEAQLAQAQKMESIGRLAGGIAHDFNNMLTAILSYNEFALGALPPGSPIARDLDEVRHAAERSVALTSQLLAFARRQVIEPKIADLNEIVARVDGLLRRVLGADVQVTTLLDARRRVKVDVSQFEQVLLNLATNARDAMPEGGVLTIRTADVDHVGGAPELGPSLPSGPYVVLSVADTGTGIAPELLTTVFEPFFTTKELGKGTGLGLATCYGIVAQNAGHITVQSELGRGATFEVFLPAIDGEVAASADASVSDRARGHETVLVVEDQASVREVTVKTLELAGYRVLAASDGPEALALARGQVSPIDLLLTDIVIPQLGGPRLAQLLTEERRELAVLFVSGYTTDLIVHRGVLDGELDLLQKPFSPAMLTTRVRQALDRRRQ